MEFKIKNGVLEGYEAENIVLPEGLTEIGSSAFEGCTSISGVDFANNSDLKMIGDSSFKGCVHLKSI